MSEFPDYDRFIKIMADAQRYKLRINRHKGDIGAVDPSRLLELLRREVDELAEAAERNSEIEVILEAADVANFALGFVISYIRQMNGDAYGVRTGISGPVLRDPVEHGPKNQESKCGGTQLLQRPIREPDRDSDRMVGGHREAPARGPGT